MLFLLRAPSLLARVVVSLSLDVRFAVVLVSDGARMIGFVVWSWRRRCWHAAVSFFGLPTRRVDCSSVERAKHLLLGIQPILKSFAITSDLRASTTSPWNQCHGNIVFVPVPIFFCDSWTAPTRTAPASVTITCSMVHVALPNQRSHFIHGGSSSDVVSRENILSTQSPVNNTVDVAGPCGGTVTSL